MEIKGFVTEVPQRRGGSGAELNAETLEIIEAAEALTNGHFLEVVFEDAKDATRRGNSVKKNAKHLVVARRGVSIFVGLR